MSCNTMEHGTLLGMDVVSEFHKQPIYLRTYLVRKQV